MNKRSIAVGLIFTIVLSFCACGKTQPRTTTNQDSFIVDATLGTATEATPTTATDAEATATEPEAMVETTTIEYTEVTKENLRTEHLASVPKEPEITTEQIVVATEAVTEAPVIEESTNSEMYYYATYATTGYVATGNVCADGQAPSAGYTVASNDPGLWNKWIYIEGVGTRYVHDRGGMASNVLDVFCSSVSECYSITSGGRAIYIYY